MTDVSTQRWAGQGPAVGSPSSTAFRAPPAGRLQAPRWRDRRLILGVALVLIAVLLGARVLAAGDRTTPVLIAAHPLQVGHDLVPGDLRVGRVHLGATGVAYWSAVDLAGLTGHPLLTSVGGGDLLARSAVAGTASPRPGRVVSLPVTPGRLPPLAAGDVVDVFATVKGAGAGPPTTVAILRGVDYVGGADSGAAGTVSVELLVPVESAGTLVAASETASIDLVLQRPAGDDAGDVGGGVFDAVGGGASSGAAASGAATPGGGTVR